MDEIRVNGNQLSWGSITVKIGNERVYGLTSVGYGEKLEVVLTYGMGKAHAPRGRTRGKYVPEPLKLGGAKSTIQSIRDKLKAQSGSNSYGITEFEVVIQHFESEETPIQVEAHRCRYVGTTVQDEESADPSKEEIECSVMSYAINGATLFEVDQ